MKKILIASLLLCIAQLGFASTGTNSNSTAAVSGVVIDAATKKPLADVTVVAIIGTNKSETVTTNSLGQFKISSLAQGTYTLKLTRDDYKNLEKKEVVVKPEASTKITIEMIAEALDNGTHRGWWDKYDLYR